MPKERPKPRVGRTRDEDFTFPGSTITDEQQAFGREMDRLKRVRDCPFPTYYQVLAWAKEFGYRRVIINAD